MKEYTVHISVLLFDDKIVNWKVGSKKWDSLMSAFTSRQPFWLLKEEEYEHRLSVDHITFKVNSDKRPSDASRWQILAF